MRRKLTIYFEKLVQIRKTNVFANKIGELFRECLLTATNRDSTARG